MSAVNWADIANSGVVLRERHPHDFYPTDSAFVESGLDMLPRVPQRILDPGMGAGIWGNVARERFPHAEIVGVELRQDAPFMRWYDWNIRADFLQMSPAPIFDCVIGNPPYKLAEDFVRHSMACLVDGGHLVFLLRLAFLESLSRYTLFTVEMPPLKIGVCSDRPSFTGDGKTDATAYAFFVWQKGHVGNTSIDWVISKPSNEHYKRYQMPLFADCG